MSNSSINEGFGFKIYALREKISYLIYLLPLVLCFAFNLTVFGQDEEPLNAAPPPVKIISKDEKSALEAVPDVKVHTRLAIDLMEARLKKAEEFTTQESFTAMFNELGGFHALMDDTIKFLNKNDPGRGKVLDNFKRFELALRAFTPRIELIRRELPEKFEFYVRRLLRTVRDTRAKAVEPLFSDKIVPNAGN
jgi:hypothetical protein